MRVLAILAAACLAGSVFGGPVLGNTVLGNTVLASPVGACSPMEVGPCEVTPMPDDGLLAPYKDACLGIFAIEEFAVTATLTGGWLLDPVAMSCDGQPVCEDCGVVWATPIPNCEGPECWDRQAPPDAPPAE